MADTTPSTPISSIPGDDTEVGSTEGTATVTVMNAIRAFKKEAEDAKRTRMRQNLENRRAYLGIQDWSHKQKGQSREFLPKVPVATEQFVAFVKRALTQFGDYYEVELSKGSRSPISGTTIRTLLNCFLDDMLVHDNKLSQFSTLLTDAIKVGSLESLCILKIHGNLVNTRLFTLEEGEPFIGEDGEQRRGEQELGTHTVKNWKLRIDLIQGENYFPDPTGAGLYEIHSVERDLHYLKRRVEEGVYNKEAVARIEEDFRSRERFDRRPVDQNQDPAIKPSFRKRVRIDEFWGTLLDDAGNVIHENIFCAMANNKYLIREPTPNPFWHQESPFVAFPIIRVPFSVWHKALFDNATQLNFAANELFNLIIDGGISAVWGIKQLRADDLANPSEVSDGIAQGTTLTVKNTLPHGQKVLETVSEGQVPSDSMAVLEMLNREFAASSLSNELKLGALPAKQVLATEINELSQSQAITHDSIISDIELETSKAISKIWLTVLQNMDDVLTEEIVNAIGMQSAITLSRLSPPERFAIFGVGCSFKVFGLSAVLAKARDFQKMMALLQAVMSNPLLMQAFFKKYSPDRVLNHIMRTLSINPANMERDDIELQRLNQDLEELPAFQALTGGGGVGAGNGGPAKPSGADTGDPSLSAEINANSNPTASLAGAGDT